MKVKLVLEYIDTYTKIKLCLGGEEFYPSYSELFRYEDYFVSNIRAEGANSIALLIYRNV